MNIIKTLQANGVQVDRAGRRISFQIGYERFTADLSTRQWSANNGTEWADYHTTRERVEEAILSCLKRA